MSLQERTLVIKYFDPEKTTSKLLKELCMQAGPVRNVVIRPDHAFVEFEDTESVGYSRALLDGVQLFGRRLQMEPKIKTRDNFKYQEQLDTYVQFDKQQRLRQEQMIAYQIQQTQMQAAMLQPQIHSQQQQQMPPPLPHTIPAQPHQPTGIPTVGLQQMQATNFGQNLFNYTPLSMNPSQCQPQVSHCHPAPDWNNFNANNIRRSRSFNNQNDQPNRGGGWQDRRDSSGRGRR